MSDYEEALKGVLELQDFDVIQVLNALSISFSADFISVIRRYIAEEKSDLIKQTENVSPVVLNENVTDLGRGCEKLSNQLAVNLRTLRLTENTNACTNEILQFDTAKTRTDELVKILKTKILWDRTHKDVQQYQNASNINRSELYQKLETLQGAYDILSKYSFGSDKILFFEKLKDEYLSWFGSQVLFAIKDKNLNALADLEKQYRTLNRLNDFVQIFCSYLRTELKSYLEQYIKLEEKSPLWCVIEQAMDSWRQGMLLEHFLTPEDDISLTVIADNICDIISEYSDALRVNAFSELESGVEPLKLFLAVSKQRNNILKQLRNMPDTYFSGRLMTFFAVVDECWGKSYNRVAYITLVNVINSMETTLRSRKCTWLAAQLEPVQVCMFDIIQNSVSIFGEDFAVHVVPALDSAFTDLCEKLKNNRVFQIDEAKREAGQSLANKNLQTETENQLSFILASGIVLQLFDNVNNTIASQNSGEGKTSTQLMKNRAYLASLNRSVVMDKSNHIAVIINDQMVQGFNQMKNSNNPVHANAAAKLPSFSSSPHNYILSVGHELLNLMNVLSTYGSDVNFMNAISSAAGRHLDFKDADVWFLNVIAKSVMQALVRAVGDVGKLRDHVKQQIKADLGYLIDASKDLRLEPIPQLLSLENSLSSKK